MEGPGGVCSHDSLGSDNNWGPAGKPTCQGPGRRVAGPGGAMEGLGG